MRCQRSRPPVFASWWTRAATTRRIEGLAGPLHDAGQRHIECRCRRGRRGDWSWRRTCWRPMRIRAPRLISSPASPTGRPLPSQCSRHWRIMSITGPSNSMFLQESRPYDPFRWSAISVSSAVRPPRLVRMARGTFSLPRFMSRPAMSTASDHLLVELHLLGGPPGHRRHPVGMARGVGIARVGESDQRMHDLVQGALAAFALHHRGGDVLLDDEDDILGIFEIADRDVLRPEKRARRRHAPPGRPRSPPGGFR